MPSKIPKPKPFRAASAVKGAAREALGTPPPTRAEPDTKKRKKKAEKHKPTLGTLLSGDSESSRSRVNLADFSVEFGPARIELVCPLLRVAQFSLGAEKGRRVAGDCGVFVAGACSPQILVRLVNAFFDGGVL